MNSMTYTLVTHSSGIARRSLLLAGLGAAGTAWPSTNTKPKVVRISNGDWAPFMGEKLPHHGFVSRIVAEAFALEGLQVDYSFYPWARAFAIAQQGDVDASIGWYRTPEREKDFWFSEPVFLESQVLFHLKERPLVWKKLDDLKGKRIGATIGYTYGAEFQAMEETQAIRVERTPSDAQNLEKLLRGRVDAVVISQAVGARLVKGMGPDRASLITFHPTPVNAGTLHVIFPKKSAASQDLLKQFDRGLKKLKASGADERYKSVD